MGPLLASVTAAAAASPSPSCARALPMRAARSTRTEDESTSPFTSASAESYDATATAKTCDTGSGEPNTKVSPDASDRGMPLQKSCASCISAKPRAKYISARSAIRVGWYSASPAIAWLDAVRTRARLRNMPVTEPLFS